MSLRVVPPSLKASEEAHTVSNLSTAHPVNGLHDTFRHGLKSAAHGHTAGTASPLQARLEKWSSTQQQLQSNLQRNNFGLSVPLRQAMEMKIVSESPHHPLLTTSALPLGGGHNLHQEILNGTDETLDTSDFMAGGRGMDEILDVSAVMERSRGI